MKGGTIHAKDEKEERKRLRSRREKWNFQILAL